MSLAAARVHARLGSALAGPRPWSVKRQRKTSRHCRGPAKNKRQDSGRPAGTAAVPRRTSDKERPPPGYGPP
eukprot:12152704-Alexandrium_andersonii.AAC.1